MSLIWLNLRSLWNQQRFFFLLIVFVQAVSAFSMLFVMGVIINNRLVPMMGHVDDSIGIGFSEPVTYGEIEDTLLELFDGPLRTAGKALSIQVRIPDSEYMHVEPHDFYLIFAQVQIKNGRYLPSSFDEEILPTQLESGRTFTEQELNSEDCKVIVLRWPYEEVVIGGEKYEVIGTRKERDTPQTVQPVVSAIVPPKKLRNLKLNLVSIEFTRFITLQEEQQIHEALDSVIPGKYSIDEASKIENEDLKASLRAGILACILMSIILAGTLTMLYLYIIDERKYKLAVFRLTGSSAWKSMKLLLGEMLLLAIPSVALGMAIFYLLQKSRLEYLYPYMETYLNRQMYEKIFGGLIAFLTLFLFVITAIKSMVSVKKQLLEAKE